MSKIYHKLLIEFIEVAKTKRVLSNYMRSGNKIGELLKYETNFLPETSCIRTRLYYVENNIHHQLLCEVCNDTVVDINIELNLPRKCSVKCAANDIVRNKKISNTNEERYGGTGFKSKIINNKIIESYCKTSGEDPDDIVNLFQLKSIKTKSIESLNINHNSNVTAPIQIDAIRAKMLKTTYDRYNDDESLDIKAPIQLRKIKEKLEETNISRYGHKSTLQNDIIQYKTWLSNLNNRKNLNDDELTTLYELLNNRDMLKEMLDKNDATYISNKLGIDRCAFVNRLVKLDLYIPSKSNIELDVIKFLNDMDIEILSNTRSIIKPLELDVYLPNHNLAIEINGLYWHSSNSIETENKEYHLNKTNLCKEKGIRLLHIFENEWTDEVKQAIWKSIIRNKIGLSKRIYGRKCVIKEIGNIDKDIFLNNNHLQGTCPSSVNIGLYHQDVLVALMTFGKSRYDKNVRWELLRYCNVIDSSVLGGASKLLKHAMMNYTGSIISYADKRRSDGGLYDTLGFKLVRESKPNYFYYKDINKLESRLQYQKHKLKDKLKIFDPTLTESANMYMNGYRKIYDCGNYVYIL